MIIMFCFVSRILIPSGGKAIAIRIVAGWGNEEPFFPRKETSFLLFAGASKHLIIKASPRQ